MATRTRKKPAKGTLIRGADGSLYHIPDKDLHAYRLPDELTGEARAFLNRQNLKSKGARVAALRGAGLVSSMPVKKAVMVAGGKTVMVKGKKAVMVGGGKTVMVKGKKAVMVGGGKTVMVKGKKAVMVGGGKTVMVKGKKAVMVNIDRLKAISKQKRK